ncbi:hypothetical protein Tco_1310835 [Tanacetum coccineum]
MTGTKFDLEIFMEEYFALLTVLREITKETIAAGIWKKLETLYMTKSLANRLYLKKKLYTFQMHPGKSQSEHIDEFPQKTRAGRTLEDDRSKKGDGVEGFMEGETGRKGYKGMISIVYNHKKSQGFVRIEDQESGYGADGYDSVDGMRIQRTGFYRKDAVRKDQDYKTRRANYVYTIDGHAVTRKTLKGRKQLGEYQTGWKIKMVNVLDFCNQRSTQQCMKSGVAKHLSVAVIQQKWVGYEMNVTLLAKVVLYVNMGFNESGEYKKTFIGSGVGTSLVQVLQGVKFVVEPQEDHTFEVEPHGNVNHVAGSHELLVSDVYDWVYTTRTEIWPTKGLLDRANGMYMVWRSSGSEWNTLWVTQSSYTGSWYRLCWKDTLYCLLREYQMVCTRLDIASADVDQVPWVDHHKLRVDDNKYVEEARSYDAAHDGLSLQLKRGALSKDIPVAKVQHR